MVTSSDAWRDEFPVLKKWLFLNHAGTSPISRRVYQALDCYQRDVLENGSVHGPNWTQAVTETRRLAAELIGASPGEVALTKSTTEGINIIAHGFPFNPSGGDNVVVPDTEYPANVYPWWNQERRGVSLHWMKEQPDGRIRVEDIERQMDSRTRILAVSFVEFASGYRMDLESLGNLCRDRGVFLVVDAIQGLGVLPLDVERCNIAALTCGMHKWLLGPTAAAFFYCRRDLMDRLEPVLVGADAVKNASDYLNYDFDLLPDARRFEYAMLNYAGIHGTQAALEFIKEIGLDIISSHVHEWTDALCLGLNERGFQIFSPRGEGEWSGIVSVIPPGNNAHELRKHLLSQEIIVNVRADRLRISPHFYNNDEDLERFFNALV